jgi:hypothetical protein
MVDGVREIGAGARHLPVDADVPPMDTVRVRGYEGEGMKMSKMTAWDVYLNRKRIDTIFYTADQAAEDVRRSLINHDGYDPGITVRKARRFKP